MLNSDLYILLLYAIILLVGITITYFTWNWFEIAIVLFLCSTLTAGFFFNNEEIWIIEEVTTGTSGYLRGGLLIFAGIMGISYYWKSFQTHLFKVPVHLAVLFLFLILSIGSTYYSIDIKNTFFRSALFIMLFLFLLGLNAWLDDKQKFEKLLNILFLVVSFILVINVITLVFNPSRVWWWKNNSRFLGLWSHPNESGGFSMIAYPIILWKFLSVNGKRKYSILLILVLNLFLHLLSGSRASIIASLAGIIIWLILQRSWIKLILITTISAILIFLAIQFSFSSFSRNESTSILELSEREIIWEGAFILAKEKPILGYGYGVESKIFEDQNKFETKGTFLNLNAQQPLHNGYLSIFIGGGIIGFLLWILAIGFPILIAISAKLSIYKLYSISTLIAILVSNMVDTAITGYLSPTDIFFWIAWIVAGKLYSLESEERNKVIISEV